MTSSLKHFVDLSTAERLGVQPGERYVVQIHRDFKAANNEHSVKLVCRLSKDFFAMLSVHQYLLKDLGAAMRKKELDKLLVAAEVIYTNGDTRLWKPAVTCHQLIRFVEDCKPSKTHPHMVCHPSAEYTRYYCVGSQFAPRLVGREKANSRHSAESFREDVLRPMVNKVRHDTGGFIVLDFGLVKMAATSFLEEVFGGMFRGHNPIFESPEEFHTLLKFKIEGSNNVGARALELAHYEMRRRFGRTL